MNKELKQRIINCLLFPAGNELEAKEKDELLEILSRKRGRQKGWRKNKEVNSVEEINSDSD